MAAESSASGYNPGLAAWVKLVVNGEYIGVYVNVEQPDKTFLKNRGLYTTNETWLYKASNVGANYELKVGNPDSPTTTDLCYSPFGAEGGGGKGKGKGKGKKRGGTTELSQTAYQEVILNNPTFRAQYDRIMAELLNGPLHPVVQHFGCIARLLYLANKPCSTVPRLIFLKLCDYLPIILDHFNRQRHKP